LKHPLSESEMSIVMDITFLSSSILDLRILSNKFLQMLGKLVPYEKAVVFLCNEVQSRLSSCAEIRCEKTLVSEYIETYHMIDYLGWLSYQNEMIVARESDKITKKEKTNLRFYKAFMQKYDIEHRILFNMVSSDGELLGMGMFCRSSIFEDFTERELEIIEMLIPYYSAAIDNSLRFERLTQNKNLAQKIYHDITEAVIILDNEMEIKYANQQAKKELEELDKTPGTLAAFFAALRADCISIKEKYVQSSGQYESIESESIQVNGGKAKIRLIPVNTLMEPDTFEFAVVIPTANEDKPHESFERNVSDEIDIETITRQFFTTMQERYSITKREIEVIGLVLEGLENREIAESLHISLFTVKSHLQNGYIKLGIKSRQELLLTYMKYVISEKFRQEFDSQTRKDVPW